MRTKYQIDAVYNELFTKNDSLKLYEKTINDLRKALVTEKAYIQTLQEQVGEVKHILNEEQVQRDELKQFQYMQRKQIETLGIKHDRNTGLLERGLTNMND